MINKAVSAINGMLIKFLVSKNMSREYQARPTIFSKAKFLLKNLLGSFYTPISKTANMRNLGKLAVDLIENEKFNESETKLIEFWNEYEKLIDTTDIITVKKTITKQMLIYWELYILNVEIRILKEQEDKSESNLKIKEIQHYLKRLILQHHTLVLDYGLFRDPDIRRHFD